MTRLLINLKRQEPYADKKKIGVAIHGCDTTSFSIEVSEVELNLLKILSEKSKEVSTYGCMPTIEVYEDLKTKEAMYWFPDEAANKFAKGEK